MPKKDKHGFTRDERGHFVKGTKPGPGNPYASKQHQWRRAFAEASTPERMRDVIDQLFALAIQGDLSAIQEVLKRGMGPYEAVDIQERLDELQQVFDRFRLAVQGGQPQRPN